MKNKIRRNIFGFIIGGIIVSITTIYAATKIYASSINIDTTNISELATGATLDTAITGLYDRLSSTECPKGYKCSKPLTPQLGDYVIMTPTKTSSTLSSSYFGFNASLNPSELNLWRVIKINDDGTIEMVSEYVSSAEVYFIGRNGYMRYVSLLQTIAAEYANNNYTIGTRNLGYTNQILTLTDTSKYTTTAPWTSSTSSNSNESYGGGDIKHKTETSLVKNILGTYQAYKVGKTTYSGYWISSRKYNYYSSDGSYSWSGVVAASNGNTYTSSAIYEYKSGSLSSTYYSKPVRPVVTLKSGLNATGSGTSDDPWVLP